MYAKSRFQDDVSRVVGLGGCKDLNTGASIVADCWPSNTKRLDEGERVRWETRQASVRTVVPRGFD